MNGVMSHAVWLKLVLLLCQLLVIINHLKIQECKMVYFVLPVGGCWLLDQCSLLLVDAPSL